MNNFRYRLHILLFTAGSISSQKNVNALCDYAVFCKWIPRGVTFVFQPLCLSQSRAPPFPIQLYNWSDNGVDGSLWRGLCAECIQSNAGLQPVVEFHYSSEGELMVPSLQASLFCFSFLHVQENKNKRWIENSVCWVSTFFFFKEYKLRICASGLRTSTCKANPAQDLNCSKSNVKMKYSLSSLPLSLRWPLEGYRSTFIMT